MNLWGVVLIGGVLSWMVKYTGHLVPRRWVQHARVIRVTDLLPVALLAALVVVQTLIDRTGDVVVDARLAGVAVAVVAILLRAPFLLVIVVAAAATAGLRALGVG